MLIWQIEYLKHAYGKIKLIMRKNLNFVIAITLVLVGTGSLVSAQTSPKKPPSGGTFEQRLVQRKSERKVQLDDRDQRRLTQRCTRTQQKVRELQQVTSKVADTRAKVYDQIDGKLWVTIGRLKLAEVDTFSLQRQRSTLESKVEGFNTVMGYYQQTLDDIAVINCQADIVGFKALVDTSRIYHKDLRARSADIRTYIIDEIKQNLDHLQEKIAIIKSIEGEV